METDDEAALEAASSASADSGAPGTNGHREPANKGQRYPAEVLTAKEARALIQACSGTAPSGIRNRALLGVLYRGGLRVSEALALYPKDVDPETGSITVLHGKGDRRRVVGVDLDAMALVERWLDRRRELGLGARDALFCTIAERDGRGRAISADYVRQLVKRLAKRAGIEKRVHPHGLRHTHAAELAAEGVPVNVVQEQLGHTSLHTTDRYLRHIAPEARVETMRSRRWDPDAEEPTNEDAPASEPERAEAA